MPRGGPDGGDGGRGGDVVLVCDESRRDLAALSLLAPSARRARRPRAGPAAPRRAGRRRGRAGPARDDRSRGSRAARYDLVEPGQRAVVAAGGVGGHGNKRFASSTRQTPRFAERGLPGEAGWIELRLKLIADAGLRRPSQRRQVVAARAHDAGGAEGRRLPVHHPGAGARDDRRRRAPTRARRHPGADRGRGGGRRARATSSSPTSSAAGCCCTSSRWAASSRPASPIPRRPTPPFAASWRPTARGSSGCRS